MTEVAESRAVQPLRRVGWLADTPAEFQDVVLDRCDLLDVAAGGRIYHAGDDAGGIFGVLDGQIELHLAGPGDAPTLAHIAARGFWVGDMAALRGRHRRFSVVARTRCKLLRLSRADMQRIGSENPAFWLHFSRLVAENLGLAVEVINALRRDDPVARTALFLLILSGDAATPQVRASQSALAAIARLSRSSVSAALTRLEACGWISRHYGRIELSNPEALAAFAEDAR